MTRIVGPDEVLERLDSLDLASPAFDKDEIESRFWQFHLDLELPTPVEIWFSTTHEYHQQLLDLNLYGTSCFPMRGSQAFYNKDSQLQLALRIGGARPAQEFAINNHRFFRGIRDASPTAFDCWRYRFFHDENILGAIEAGLGSFLIRPGLVILTPRPALRMHRERGGWALHSTRGPAVEFKDDTVANQWWLRGTRVRQFVVEQPERITRAHIRAARTPRVRRTLIDQYGLLRYSIERGFHRVDHDDRFGVTLYAKGGIRNIYGDTSHRECILELVNSTPEPDGTRRHFARRVPGTMTTAHEAVAWTFGLPPDQYQPALQT